MANFWTSIKAANGVNAMGVIALHKKLGQEGGSDNPQGIRVIRATERIGGQPGYDLTNLGDDEPTSADVKEVYWLPWMQCKVEKVTLADLNNSGCNYFLTSMLDGCRFVANDELVAHIAYQQPYLSDKSGSSQARDNAELKMMEGRTPVNRRKLSISDVNWDGLYWNDDDRHLSYKRAGTKACGSAFVIGYKDNGTWNFKWLKHDVSSTNSSGTWSIL